MTHRDKHLQDLAKMINYIITSTSHATTDEKIRTMIANSISRAISMSQTKGGAVETGEDTKIYKIATLMKTCESWTDFIENIKKLKIFAGNPVSVLTSYGLKWKFKNHKVVIPEDVMFKMQPKKSVEGMTEMPKSTKPALTSAPVEEAVAKAVGEITAKYEKILGELVYKFRNHKHIVDEHGREKIVLARYEEV